MNEDQKVFEVQTIAKSNGQLDIPLIKIKNFAVEDEKPIIFILGRQHSGETHSSYIIQGLINYLVSQNPQAMQIRD